jgi:hypothetical protein
LQQSVPDVPGIYGSPHSTPSVKRALQNVV